MQSLTHFKQNIQKYLTRFNIAFILFLSTFAFKHFFSIVHSFQDIDLLWINKGLKYSLVGLLGLFFLNDIYQKRVNLRFLALFVIYVLIFVIKLIIFYKSPEFVKEYFRWNFNVLTGTGAFFLLGYYLPKELSNVQKYSLIGLIFLIFLYDMQFVDLKIYTGINLYLVKDYSLRSDYQMWGDSFALLSLLAVFSSRGIIKYSLALIGAVGVALLLSRASLISYCLALYFGLFFTKDKKAVFTLTILGVIGLIGLYFGSPRIRALNFTNLSDSSLKARLDVIKFGIDSILANPITGEFLGQLKNNSEKFNKVGFYIHNYLSIWRQFGLVSFIVFLIYYFKSAKLFVFQAKYASYIGIVIYILVSVVLFRSYVFPFFWLVSGLTLAHIKDDAQHS